VVAGYKADTMDEIWIVDDDQSIRWVLERALAKEGFRVRSFREARDVIAALDESVPRVLVSDIRMPGESGIELLYQARQKRPTMPVIIMTAYSDLDSAVSAFQGGAFEYLPKPFDLSQAIELIRRAVNENDVAQEPAEAALEGQDMLGQAPAMQEVFRAIGRLSQSSVTVLVTGESGTGKELIARALHRHSARAAKPFVALNMAAIPRDLLESELFGHERGSFTGAQQQRRGRFEQADGGTLFLDEIGDMPAEMQTRLLRVLSEGHYYRVGGHQAIKSNVRVIAATHQNLEERARQGLFREDLFHRLNVIRLRLPPLRDRVEDVPLLARHFLARSAADLGVEAKRLAPDAIEWLQRAEWPGNVRQLENVCNWLTVMAPTQVISARDLPPEIIASRQGAAATAAVGASGASSFPGSSGVSGAATSLPARSPAPGGDSAFALPREDGMPLQAGANVPPSLEGLLGSRDADAGGTIGAIGAGRPPMVGGAADRTAGLPDTGGSPDALPPWAELLAREAARQLAASGEISGNAPAEGNEQAGIMARLTRIFEATMIRAALKHTRGRRVEAAQRLGIGRNTITRKIQELGLDD
jgi:two-component system, NtrC family, nitrogen regulation response regulator GlnG